MDKRTCLSCSGTGYVATNLCPVCQGSGEVPRQYYAFQGVLMLVALLAVGWICGWPTAWGLIQMPFRLVSKFFGPEIGLLAVIIFFVFWGWIALDAFRDWRKQRSRSKAR